MAAWLEADARFGDRVRVGSTGWAGTPPRSPCSKRNAAFARPDRIERFRDSRRSDLDLELVPQGAHRVGDPILRIAQVDGAPPIAALTARPDA